MQVFRRLLFQVVLWAVLPLLTITAVSVVSVYGHQKAEQDLVAARVARLAHVAASALANQLEDNAHILHALGLAEAVRPSAVLTPLSASQAASWETVFDRGIAVLTPDGQTVGILGDAASWTTLPAVQGIVREAQTNSPAAVAVQQPLSGANAGENQLVVVQAVRATTQETVVGAFTPVSLGIDHLFDDLQLGARGAGYIVDGAGTVIYRRSADAAGQGGGLSVLLPETAGNSGALFRKDAGELWAVGYAPVPATGWTVIVRESWADAVGPMARFSVVSPILVIIAALVSLLAVYLILRYVIRPLQRLGRMADRVAYGDFAAVDQPLAGVQEIQELQRTLRHMIDQLRRYQSGMQDYVTAVMQGQEEERKRLARELHDDTAQGLVALVQRIKLTRRDLKRDPARAEERLAELEQLATATWQDVRRFSEDLRPAYLEQFGLEPALATLTEQAGSLPGAPQVTFTVEGVVRRPRSEVELALFRIVQEALNNARQHAQADRIDVRLHYEADSVSVTISDDGRGFRAPEFPTSLAQSGHFGLAGIRERSLLIGGRLTIVTEPGQGTRIEVVVPLLDSEGAAP